MAQIPGAELDYIPDAPDGEGGWTISGFYIPDDEFGYPLGYETGFEDGYAFAQAEFPDAPVITIISPAPNTAIDPDEAIIFSVVSQGDGNLLSHVNVSALQGDGDSPEEAYNGTAFSGGYSLSDVDPIADGFEFELVRDDDWRGVTLTVRIVAIDVNGNETIEEHQWTTVAVPIESAFLYRMRGFDETLSQLVFWSSGTIDANGDDYAGPGPVVDVVVQMVRGT